MVTHGTDRGRVIALGMAGHKTRIGRDPTCEVHIDDPSLSRVHALIRSVRNQFFIEDQNSHNGTRRNGVVVEFAAALEPGDRITLGNVRLRYAEVDETELRALLEVFERSGRTATSAEQRPFRRTARTPGLASVFETAERAASSGLSILLLGETGTGKDVLAEAIHEASPRAARELLSINCAALTETLLEAELFGHERGAFTGATTSKAGLLEAADGGTVFLDEVGELPLPTQAKLLRVLESRRVMRVGGRQAKAIDVRFVSATNRDLEGAVEAGTFRRDLLYRLNAVTLTVPPLRERLKDVPILAAVFLEEASHLAGGPTRRLAPEVMAAFLRHDWPGNVRELRNVIERAVVLGKGDELGLDSMPTSLLANRASASISQRPSPAEAKGGKLLDAVGEAEKAQILKVLEEHRGNQTTAASSLGISRRTLVARLSAWGLTRKRP